MVVQRVVPDEVRDGPATPAEAARTDFTAHLAAHYQRLVAQMYAMTLDAAEAHDAVQDAYSRAWHSWSEVGASPDPAAWVRRVAVRSTGRSWRRLVGRLGRGGAARRVEETVDARTAALLAALRRLPAPERRAVVLAHMVGMTPAEVAELEQVPEHVVDARLDRARHVVIEGMADVLSAVLGPVDGQEYG